MNKIPAIIFGLLPVIGIWFTSMPNIRRILNLDNAKHPSFSSRHYKAISSIGNISLLLWISWVFYMNMRRPILDLLKFPEGTQYSNVSILWMKVPSLLGGMLGSFGIAIAPAAFLSCFQCSITKTKRIILLIFCLLPIALTSAELAVQSKLGFYIESWLIIKLGLLSTLSAWSFNGATIIFGKHIMTLCAMGIIKIIAHLKKPVL